MADAGRGGFGSRGGDRGRGRGRGRGRRGGGKSDVRTKEDMRLWQY